MTQAPTATTPATIVVLDLGGVVVRIARTWRARAEAAGLPLREVARCEAALTACWDGMMRLQRGSSTTADLARQLHEETNGAYSERQFVLALNSQLLGPFSGVFAVIEQLCAPHAIFSNTSADHWEMLLTYDVVKAARWRVASFQIGAIKPDPEAYSAFEATIGQPGNRLLFFDDSPDNVQAARACGWQAERIDPTEVTATVAEQLRAHLGKRGLLRP